MHTFITNVSKKNNNNLIQLSYPFFLNGSDLHHSASSASFYLKDVFCKLSESGFFFFFFFWPWFAPFQDNEFLSVRFRVFSEDAMNSSHPVSTKVTAPEEVEEMFDSVSYDKVAYSEHVSSCVLQATN